MLDVCLKADHFDQIDQMSAGGQLVFVSNVIQPAAVVRQVIQIAASGPLLDRSMCDVRRHPSKILTTAGRPFIADHKCRHDNNKN